MKTEILIKKLLKNEIKENLKLFSDIKISKEYSNLNKELTVQYHHYTYSAFYRNLKNTVLLARQRNANNLISFSPYPEDDPNKRRKFDIEKMREAIKRMKEEEKIEEKKKIHPYTERNRDSLSFNIYGLLKTKKKIIEKIRKKREEDNKKIVAPSLGKYNPKYKAIEKHISRTIFTFKNFKNYNTIYNQKLMIKKKKKKEEDKMFKAKIENMKKKLNRFSVKLKKSAKNKSKKEKINKITSKTDRNEENSKDIPNLFQNTAVNRTSRNTERNLSQNKDNHCFKFETYTSRKPLLIQTTYRGDSTPKILKPIQSVKGNIRYINYKKHFSRNFMEEIINNKKDIPSIGFYRPNYSSVTSKTIDIYFNGKKDQKENIKYNKLKKILGNYNVRGEYELFDFLNNKNDENKKDF